MLRNILLRIHLGARHQLVLNKSYCQESQFTKTSDQLDVVIFGASGFTGKLVVMESVKSLSKLKWGISGRSEVKLKNVLKEIAGKTETDLSKIPILIADVNDEKSLTNLASKCKLIVNCCGPFRFYGEQVVKASINSGTHYVDVSGETAFMEQMQLKYNDLAEEKGVYAVTACGFDCVPADMGTVFFETNFDGVVNSIETYLTFSTKDGYKRGTFGNFASWQSLIYAFSNKEELAQIRSQLFAEPLPIMAPKLKNRLGIHKSDIAKNHWCIPLPVADRSVVQRSQRIMYKNDKKRPVQIRTYIGIKPVTNLIRCMTVLGILKILTRFSWGTSLSLKYPKLFSLGFVSHKQPPEESVIYTDFSMVIHGSGWPKGESTIEPNKQNINPPTKTLTIKLSASNPAYGATSVAVLLAAKTILNESTKMPGKGGVLPPGAAYAKTSYINELCKNGYTFEVVPDKNKMKE